MWFRSWDGPGLTITSFTPKQWQPPMYSAFDSPDGSLDVSTWSCLLLVYNEGQQWLTIVTFRSAPYVFASWGHFYSSQRVLSCVWTHSTTGSVFVSTQWRVNFGFSPPGSVFYVRPRPGAGEFFPSLSVSVSTRPRPVLYGGLVSHLHGSVFRVSGPHSGTSEWCGLSPSFREVTRTVLSRFKIEHAVQS